MNTKTFVLALALAATTAIAQPEQNEPQRRGVVPRRPQAQPPRQNPNTLPMVREVPLAGEQLLLADPQPPQRIRQCTTEPAPGTPIFWGGLEGGSGGGMAGNGWDGAGLGATTIFWHQENESPDLPAADIRAAYITAMEAWAGVVQLSFEERPTANLNRSVDWAYATGDHCSLESAECGDPDCPFAGPSGVLAHAGFPPGVNSTCINPMAETFSGNVHFDDDETWELDNAAGSGPFSLTLIACHEVGHGIGLTHSSSPDVMRPSFSSNDGFVGISANDIANLRAGYAAGSGAVITLEDTGVWVNNTWGGAQLGIQTSPFVNVVQGVNGVPRGNSGVVLHVQAGTYAQTGLIDKRMTIQREGAGSVIIE